ncbi:MAG TPA: ATP-binding protein [Spirochaetota bacterium]|nr:ATP-binding protein [Spirochaetota bacterium]
MQYSVCDYLLDLTQNSVESGATFITLDILESQDKLEICIGDDGCGMDGQTLQKAKDPFFTDGVKHTNRKVGLGIPFVMQAVESTGGEFDIKSEKGVGTSLYLSFIKAHVDMPPIGDLAGTLRSIMLFDAQYDLLIYRSNNEESYRVSRSELKDAVGEFSDTDSLVLIKQFFSSQEEDIS